MQDNYRKLFNILRSALPQAGLAHLESVILSRINLEVKSRARQMLWLFGCGSLGAFGLLVYLFKYIIQAFSHSGFYEYLSLAFSGDSTVFIYWKEFAFSVLDSLPLLTLIAFLGTIVVFIWTSANAYTSARKIFGRVILSTN